MVLTHMAPLGEPPAPPLSPGRRRELSDARVDDAVERARLRSMVKRPDGEAIGDDVIDQLLAGVSSEEEIAGPGGLLAQLTKRLVERAMEVELTDHLGYEPHQEPPGGAGNTRNGSSPKTLITEHGQVGIDAPRDRDGSFEPRIVRKRQRRFQGFDDKIDLRARLPVL
jgi:Transposase, Mutator family